MRNLDGYASFFAEARAKQGIHKQRRQRGESNSNKAHKEYLAHIYADRTPKDYARVKQAVKKDLRHGRRWSILVDGFVADKGTPSRSQWYDKNVTISSNRETQDYFSGTQPERLDRSQIDCFEGVIGEINRPWTQDQVEDEEDENDVETTVGTIVSKKTASKQRNKTATTGRGEKNTATQSLALIDIDPPNEAVEIQYRLLTRCFFEGKSIKQGRLNPTIKDDLGSTVDIRKLITEQQVIAKAYADSLGYACQRVSIRALASHERTTAKQKNEDELDVEETPFFWNQLEDDIKRWYEQKKNDLTITLTSHWGRRSDGAISISMPPSQQETSSSTNKPKNTSTIKLQAERQEYQDR